MTGTQLKKIPRSLLITLDFSSNSWCTFENLSFYLMVAVQLKHSDCHFIPAIGLQLKTTEFFLFLLWLRPLPRMDDAIFKIVDFRFFSDSCP